MPAHDEGPRPRLTKEQDEQRLRGLRALARLIVRAHLAATTGNAGSPNAERAEPPRKEERRAE
ncbi:MAG: hypothetical protein F4X26_02250 [Chloroflexi bacterium]|nr:hypothetical protein [Chloroflexota bacterium]